MDARKLGLRHRSLINALLNRALSDGGLAEGTNPGTFQNAAAINFLHKGQFFSKGITDNVAFVAADGADAFVTQPDLSTAYYLILLDKAGNFRVVQGRDSTKPKAQGKPAPGAIPEVPSDAYVVVGVLKVVLSGGTFLPGTTDLSGTGVTDTWYDVSCIPAGGEADL